MESFKDRILLRNIKKKLTPKEKALFKLVVWCCLLVWMTFFVTNSIIISRIITNWAPQLFPPTPYYQMLARSLPFWYVFTISLTVFIIVRWSYRKLKPKFRIKDEEKKSE